MVCSVDLVVSCPFDPWAKMKESSNANQIKGGFDKHDGGPEEHGYDDLRMISHEPDGSE